MRLDDAHLVPEVAARLQTTELRLLAARLIVGLLRDGAVWLQQDGELDWRRLRHLLEGDDS